MDSRGLPEITGPFPYRLPVIGTRDVCFCSGNWSSRSFLTRHLRPGRAWGRDMAAEERVSVATVRRDLARAAAGRRATGVGSAPLLQPRNRHL
jgi:hypothetical protein